MRYMCINIEISVYAVLAGAKVGQNLALLSIVVIVNHHAVFAGDLRRSHY